MTPRSSPPRSSTTSVDPFHPAQHGQPQQFFYPPVPNLRQPPATYAGHPRRSSGQRVDTSHLQSSTSSAASASTILSYHQQYPSPANTWTFPIGDRSIVEADPDRNQSQWEKVGSKSRACGSQPEMVENSSTVMRYLQEQQRVGGKEEEEEEGEGEENDHAIWVLFWLSFLDPVHSLVSCFYTIVVILILAIASPVRWLRKQDSYGDQLIRTVAPLLRHHLQQMYAFSVHEAHTFVFSPIALVGVHLTAPFVSLLVTLAAWVSAAFWVFAVIMGNPDGTEKRDDGRDAVLYVRNRWEKYLLGSLKHKRGRSTRSEV